MKKLILAIFFSSKSVFSAEIQLMARANWVPDYDDLVRKIQADDRVAFERQNGSILVLPVQEILSTGREGNTEGIHSFIFAISKSQVARIPAGLHLNNLNASEKFWIGANQMASFQGKRVVRLFERQSIHEKVIIAERLTIRFTYLQFVSSYNSAVMKKKELPQRLEIGSEVLDPAEFLADLRLLAQDFSLYSRSGDFGEQQIGWVNDRGWVLFDLWEVFLAQNQDDPNLFLRFELPKGFSSEIADAVHTSRVQKGLKKSECSDSFSDLADLDF